jgi:hypothetical protein
MAAVLGSQSANIIEHFSLWIRGGARTPPPHPNDRIYYCLPAKDETDTHKCSGPYLRGNSLQLNLPKDAGRPLQREVIDHKVPTNFDSTILAQRLGPSSSYFATIQRPLSQTPS